MSANNPHEGVQRTERDDDLTLVQWHNTPLPPSSPLTASSHVGDYELLAEVGRGGMGVVFKARHTRLNRTVALKMIRGGALADIEDLHRFEKEAEASAQLQHPNIVGLFEVGNHEGQPYFSMEFISGTSLADHVELGPLPGRRAAAYLEATARAVHYAHGRGVLHRDLKPANVLLDEHDHPKITDFGLAKLMTTDSGQTRTGAVLGTPSYMSPEQAAGRKDLGPASDVYSLGAILYELLTGRPPLCGDTPLATLNLVAEQDPVSPRLLNPMVERDLETICLKCLEKDPARRYSSAEALADDLHRYLGHEPISARRVTTVGRVKRWCHRYPAWAAVSVFAVLALVGFVIYEWRTVLEEKELRAQAQQAGQLAQARLDTMRHLLYLAEIRQAQHALEHADFERAERLLAHWLPNEDEEGDLRGWEWFFLKQQCRGRRTLGQHQGHAWAVAYSPNGQSVASAGGEYNRPAEIKIWDLRTGKLVHSLSGHRDRITALVYHPTRKLLASSSYDRTIRLWDVDHGEPVAVLQGHSGQVNGIAFSPDGDLLASAGGDGTVRLWRDSSFFPAKEPEVQVLTGHTGEVAAVAFQPRGHVLASAGHDQTVRIWNATNGRLVTSLTGHEGPVECLAFGPNGKLLASGGGLGSQQGDVKLWDMATMQPRSARYGLSDRILGLAFSRDGKLAAGGADGVIRVWNRAISSEALTFRADTQWINGLAFSPDGHTLASAGRSGRINIWNASGGLESLTLTAPGIQEAIAFSPVGKLLASAGAGDGGQVRIWKLDSPDQPIVLSGQSGGVLALAFDAAGQRLACGGEDGKVRIYDVQHPAQPSRILPAGGGRVLALAYGLDQRLAVAGDESPIRIYDTASGSLLKVLDGHGNSVLAVAFSFDGRWLASGSYDRTVRVWDVEGGVDHYVLSGHTGSVAALAFSPEAKQLATAGSDKIVRVWDLVARKELYKLEGSPAGLTALAYHPHGRRLVTAGQDKLLRLWDLSTRQELLELEEMQGPIRDAAFSEGGRYLAGAATGVVRVWDASSHKE